MMMLKDQTHIKRNCFSIGIISSNLQSGCYKGAASSSFTNCTYELPELGTTFPNFLHFNPFSGKNHIWTLENFNVNFGPFARRHSLWRRGNTARRHRLWRRGTCCAVTTRTLWRRRGTELGAKIYGAELGYISIKLI
jgi:hypothetical protein